MLGPNTTLAEIAASEELQQALTDAIMPQVRGALRERRVSYGTADRVAQGVRHGVRNAVGRIVEEVPEEGRASS
jgi:hypothetical protein